MTPIHCTPDPRPAHSLALDLPRPAAVTSVPSIPESHTGLVHGHQSDVQICLHLCVRLLGTTHVLYMMLIKMSYFRPLNATLEAVLGLSHQLTPQEFAEESHLSVNYATFAPESSAAPDEEEGQGRRRSKRRAWSGRRPRVSVNLAMRWLVKLLLLVTLVVITIVWPDFERIVGVLGSSGAIIVSVMFPLASDIVSAWREGRRGLKVSRDAVLLGVAVCKCAGAMLFVP